MHDVECETIDDVRAERDALGIQLAAQGERLRLAMEAVTMMSPLLEQRPHTVDVYDRARDAKAALDAVPGDALAHGALASSGRLERALADRK